MLWAKNCSCICVIVARWLKCHIYQLRFGGGEKKLSVLQAIQNAAGKLKYFRHGIKIV